MKPLEDRGHALQLHKPIAIKRYEPNRLPDPGQCVDCLIIVNDRKDGVPRGRLAVSNGASWDYVAWMDDARSSAVPVVPATVDLVPIVRNAVAEMLPALQTREVKTIAAIPASDTDTAAIAQALLEMSEAINRLTRDKHDLENRVAYLEANSLARATLIREAS
jgi:hypothetical protein